MAASAAIPARPAMEAGSEVAGLGRRCSSHPRGVPPHSCHPRRRSRFHRRRPAETQTLSNRTSANWTSAVAPLPGRNRPHPDFPHRISANWISAVRRPPFRPLRRRTIPFSAPRNCQNQSHCRHRRSRRRHWGLTYLRRRSATQPELKRYRARAGRTSLRRRTALAPRRNHRCGDWLGRLRPFPYPPFRPG